jgi:hypothetical protein
MPGKTIVARLYAKLLQELGILASGRSEETSGSKLASEGVNGLKALLLNLGEGGMLIIDEAPQLVPEGARSGPGEEILRFLIPEVENQRGKLVVVLAGYKKDMERLVAFDPGLASRFPRKFNFEDYSDEELTTILAGMLEEQPRFTVPDPKILRIAARRLGQQRGEAGFGNARAARNLLEISKDRQASRLQEIRRKKGTIPQSAMFTLERDDILGPRGLDLSSSPAVRELEEMIGLERVKAAARDLLELVKTNAELEEAEQPTRPVNLNRIFLGNPGTGKATLDEK